MRQVKIKIESDRQEEGEYEIYYGRWRVRAMKNKR